MRHLVFVFNDTATTEIYTLSLHDALPICLSHRQGLHTGTAPVVGDRLGRGTASGPYRSGSYSEPDRRLSAGTRPSRRAVGLRSEEHTSNSSHANISYAVFCLKKKKQNLDP